MPLIDKETVQQITDRADIVEVVGDYVHLVRRGANYMGLCPFHNERTPSFSVNKRKNFCFCFSCKQGGSPVNFIMKKEGLSYHEALLHLAKKYGIEVRQRELTDEERKQQSLRESMFVANEWAMQRMMDNLFNTEEGKEIGLSYFFGKRNITKEAVDAFKLGYAIDRGDALTTDAHKAGIDIDVLKKVGLLGTSQDGRTYDKYRGRVIFPILNTAGKVIGFGGRTLKNDKAKYINSPESEIYKKSNELYGIYQARAAIGRDDKCFLVEGYFDVIGMWQAGLKNVVASSGTALTDGQIALIHRFTENITLIYDGDKAGIKAALRGVDMLLHHKMKVKVLLLPDGDDPDSFAAKHTPEEFREYVDSNETDVISFKAKVLVNDMKEDPQRRIEALKEMITTLAHISDQIARDVYIQECSRLMDLPAETILKSVVTRRRELVEQWKRERTYKEISKFSPESVPTTQSLGIDQPINPSKTLTQPVTGNLVSPLYKLEKRLLEYLVKYGYLPFCEVSDPITEDPSTSGNKKWWTVFDFISNDLELDGISFSVDIFLKVFTTLRTHKELFVNARAKVEKEIKEESLTRRKAGYEEIAQMNLSIDEIRREEKRLEQEIEKKEIADLTEFERNYPIRLLANHEETAIRELANDLAFERHQLSNIYYRDNNSVETEEDKLDILVPRALNELKSEILNLQIKQLFWDLTEASSQGDAERVGSLQKEINDRIHQRAEMAKDLGERILSPTGLGVKG